MKTWKQYNHNIHTKCTRVGQKPCNPPPSPNTSVLPVSWLQKTGFRTNEAQILQLKQSSTRIGTWIFSFMWNVWSENRISHCQSKRSSLWSSKFCFSFARNLKKTCLQNMENFCSNYVKLFFLMDFCFFIFFFWESLTRLFSTKILEPEIK